jgi:hypothetical protein
MPEEKPAKDPKEILVFSILRNAKCAECGGELSSGSFLTFENNQPHCLACADLDHLAFLGRGDVCVTRRAKKYSALSAVVLRFSRARSRYERQGILVEEPALDRAEEECEKDADKRAAKRAKAELQRVVEDKEFTAQMAEELRRLFPRAPLKEIREIAAHATVRSSGRVGRTAGAKSFDEGKLTAAVIAAIRHRHTRYDELLMTGYDRMDARQRTRGDVDEVLERWRSGE